jgi:DNA-binding GntR family transcriptional regulator
MSDEYDLLIKHNYDNIKNILANSEYMELLDINKNNLCIKMKQMNPTIDDKLIQAYVFSSWQILLMEIS